jgi:Trehalase
VLSTGAMLATAEGDTASQTLYSTKATQLRTSINTLLWDATKGAYHDNASTSALAYPQDGNSLAVWFGVADSVAKVQAVMTYLKGNWNAFGASTPEWSGNDHPYPGSMEVLAHFTAGDDSNGLALIRTEWGYMLNAAIGTGSTFWEGYNKDGSLAYNAGYTGAPAGIYTSLAHGWATGPTSALTNYVLGIAPDTAGGATYHVIPHHGDLTQVQGRLTLPVGAVDAAWISTPGQGFQLSVGAADTGAATATVAVPRDGADRVVYVDGSEAWNGSSFTGSPGIAAASQDANYIYFTGVSAGDRTFSWGSVLSASVPESPLVALLPLGALVAIAGVTVRHRRRPRRRRTAP